MSHKLVQKAVMCVLNSVYEVDFLGFSYGLRPGRSQHTALDALDVAITSQKVNWGLDADIKGFVDTIDHEWLVKFLEHRIGDKRILRLIRKWLRAGVSEEGQWSATTVGTPQGAVILPLLGSVFLHYVLDLWIQNWRGRNCRGDVVIVRYADDFIIGFQHRYEAVACLEAIKERMGKFGLELHGGKTRLLEFGRFAASNRAERGLGTPETFDFLGFTHVCDVTRRGGRFRVKRISIAKRIQAKLAEIKEKLRRHRHRPVGETGRWLGKVVQGWLNYHAVPLNRVRSQLFRDEIVKMWLAVLRRRSQRSRWTWSRMQRLARKHLPAPRILHPYPNQRHAARLKARAV
ncbi:reverse transcriptase domain-containing protein [Allorhodopirellula solitaria]|uniref:Group II intron-encoded protein LtrA n=1 Tax=Allorhodopirellula solitaria TaxID=2527987 RepID=A0A5C5XTC0_9BACT|nr:reverse transcriptase domain-containing protein [Allorhodopirellula solitaria]TWT65255.1 Group II intron-encoded protein LtrA [Allorhodopirellula solitaria]